MLGAILGLLGSVQAKVVKTQKARQTQPTVNFNTSSWTWVTALSVSGKGTIHGIIFAGSNSNGQYSHFRITIDGNVIMQDMPVGSGLYLGSSGNTSPYDSSIQYEYTQSFLIECYAGNYSGLTAGITCTYSKEV